MTKLRYFDFAKLSGEVLEGRYQLSTLLGEGGQAGVFRAWDKRAGRPSAVKILRPDNSAGAVSRRKRFEREAFALTRLDHPNCVKVFSTGQDDKHNVHFMVMEMVEGQPLDIFIHFPLTERQIVSIGRGMALGLSEAHRHGIYHRDLKPENVVLRPMSRRVDHRPVLIDFGIAKFSEGYQMTLLTGSEMVLGTVQYMSPEQAEGLPLDARTDIYSLGVVLYELITGAPPFTGKPIHVLQAHLSEPVPSMKAKANLSPSSELVSIISVCLKKRRDDRYEGGDACASALSMLLSTLSVSPTASVVTCMAPDPHHKLLALGFQCGEVEIRDLQSGARIARWTAHKAPVCGVAFAHDGEVLLSADETGVLAAWDRQGSAVAEPAQPMESGISVLAASATGSFYALGSTDGRVRVLAWGRAQPIAEFQSHRARVNRLLFDRAGQLLISAGDDGAVLVWGLGQLEVENRFAVEGNAATGIGYEGRTGTIAMGSDTGRITVGRLDGSVRESTFFAHAASVTNLNLVWNDDGDLDIISSGLDGELRQWSARDGAARPYAGLHPSGVRSSCVLPDGTVLATNDCQILSWAEAFRDPTRGCPERVISPYVAEGWVDC